MFGIMGPRRASFLCFALFVVSLGACTEEEKQPGGCLPGSQGCVCLDAGVCDPTLVCSVDAGVCQVSGDCATFGCGSMQRCGVPDGGLDIECLPECETGAVWVDRIGRCVAEPERCEDTDAQSTAATCRAENRLCFIAQDGAACAGCKAGFAEVDARCVALKTCAELECAGMGRECQEATSSGNAECSVCLDGYREEGGVCTREACGPTPAVGSVLSTCGDSRRVCREDGGKVSCGDCLVNHVEEDGQCRATRSCADQGCEQQDRLCVPASAHGDAQCGACRAGFSEEAEECRALLGATCDAGATTLVQACGSEHRACVLESVGAACGGCEDGYVWDERLSACAPKVLCAALNCAAEHRGCENFPNGHCTGCESGFVENPEDGTCRAVAGCAALTCANGTVCLAGATPLGDAACVHDCGADAVWNGKRCEACPPCDGAGEQGRYPKPTRAGYCICETKPGYFYSTAGAVGTRRCDEDGDGWMRESARLAFSSSDPVLSTNARCNVRVIDSFVLENDRGQTQRVALDRPLPLFESDRNDDDVLLKATFAARGLPAKFGNSENARLPKAAELNRLTKLCHHLRADYNDNGAFDVVEWGEAPISPVLTQEQQPFNRFSYFAELHQGFHVSPGPNDAYGHYRIVERKRPSAGAGSAGEIQLSYAAGAGDSWRTCDRDRDALVESDSVLPVGLDLASFYTPAVSPYLAEALPFRGMMHHSQFKCLTLSNAPEPSLPTALRPSDLAGFDLNTCSLEGPGAALGQGENAYDAPLRCETLSSADARVEAGAVLWGASKYRDHGSWGAPADQADYLRGCRNGCFGALSGCEGFSTNPRAVACDYDALDFGRFISCSVAEICDGIDNDENPATPDGSEDPLLHASCAPDAKGECLLQGGTYVCLSATPWLWCEPHFVATATETACDNRDEDCNGFVDDGDPGNDGAVCTPNAEEFEIAGLGPEHRFGQCAKGRRGRCVNGRNACEVVTVPQAEICGNDLDDDCDGKVDESEMLLANGTATLAGYGLNRQPSCTDYYRDKDGDQFGTNLEGVCLCRPNNAPAVHVVTANEAPLPGTYVHRSDARNDCCDTGPTDGSKEIYPGATGWLSSIGPCGNYDKDCNGASEQEYKATGAKNCGGVDVGCWTSSHSGPCCQDAKCQAPVVGWDGTPPICGGSGQFITGGCGCAVSGTRCGDANTEARTQRCR